MNDMNARRAHLTFDSPTRPRRSPGIGSLMTRGAGILGAAVTVAAVLGASGPSTEVGTLNYSGTVTLSSLERLPPALDTMPAVLEAEFEMRRALSLIDYSARYNIPADLAALIYDTALGEGIDPELGFRLVYVESRFQPKAKSSAGAIGLAQLLPSTARFFVAGVSADQLYDRSLNLRIGFRFLGELLDAFDDDLPLALIAYNRGPGRLRELLSDGVEPWNGYASSVLNGYSPPDGTSLQ